MLVDGPHFQATDDGDLVFLPSDGDSSRRPAEHEIIDLEEESGTLQQNYYLRVFFHSTTRRDVPARLGLEAPALVSSNL